VLRCLFCALRVVLANIQIVATPPLPHFDDSLRKIQLLFLRPKSLRNGQDRREGAMSESCVNSGSAAMRRN
jgi:hypothetical protein